MVAKNLLIELFVEELPPKALKNLGASFASLIFEGLKSREFVNETSRITSFATPRRLAVHISDVLPTSPDKEVFIKLMPAAVAIGADGKPTDAFRKRLAKEGRAHLAEKWPNASDGPDRLMVQKDGKTDAVYLRSMAVGGSLQVGLQGSLDETLEALPIPKEMSYQLKDGWTTVKFVRPAHGLVALHGDAIIPVSALGLEAARTTKGHRFEATQSVINLKDADTYCVQLRDEGFVIAEFKQRRREIATQLARAASKAGLAWSEIESEDLLDEVAALVEWPNVVTCEFEKEFLQVPPECLILTMKTNQKYFPLFNTDETLSNKFLVVANIKPNDASNVIEGNERVVRPRLADAKFFFEQDRKKPLISHLDGLAKVVYHNKLGSQRDRVGRIEALATFIADRLLKGNWRSEIVQEAARLSKCDLLTLMVGEFPELQGIMGRYYALAEGKSKEVADAIREQYLPRGAGDELPKTYPGMVLALAEKIDTIAGIFAIDQKPTGAKDPFGVRRAAIGIQRILLENALDIDLLNVIERALILQPISAKAAIAADVYDYIMERLRAFYLESNLHDGITTEIFDAVLATRPSSPVDFSKRVKALSSFISTENPTHNLDDWKSLSAANKRASNLLRKSDASGLGKVEPTQLVESAEKILYEQITETLELVEPLLAMSDYKGVLIKFASLRGALDAFFDTVLVMTEDMSLRRNRLALLSQLRGLFLRVADLSRLPG